MSLDIVTFPSPVDEAIDFLTDNLTGDVVVGAVLPETYADHVLVFATSTDTELTVRRTRYIYECRSTTHADAALLAEEVAALVSAWCRSDLENHPVGYSLLSLVDSYPDLNQIPRAVATVEVHFQALPKK